MGAALDVTNRLMESLVKRVSCELSFMHLVLGGGTGNAEGMEVSGSESDSDAVEGSRLSASGTSKARKKLFSDKSLLEWFNEQKHLLSMTAPVVPAKPSGGMAHTRRTPIHEATTTSPRDQSSCFHLSEMRLGDMEASLSSQTSSLWSKGSHKTVGYPRPSSELHPDHIIASQKYEQGVCGKVDHCIEEGKEGQSFVDVRVCLPLAEQENPQI